MRPIESSKSDEPHYSNQELRFLLSWQAPPEEHIKGMLALGLTVEDLFGALDFRTADMGLVFRDGAEKMKEVLGEGGEAETILLSWGARKEALADGVDTYIDDYVIRHNTEIIDRFGDEEFLARQRRQVLGYLSRTAEILMEDESNRPLIGAWLLTPNQRCEGERPIDRIKIDPVQTCMAAYAELTA